MKLNSTSPLFAPGLESERETIILGAQDVFNRKRAVT